WLVIDYERPLENTRQWHNVEDAEQHYGILGMYAGDDSAVGRLGGSAVGWRRMTPLGETDRLSLRVASDESYVYLAVGIPDFTGKPFPAGGRQVMIALDSYRADRGQRRLPGGLVAADIGFEFLATFRDTSDAE